MTDFLLEIYGEEIPSSSQLSAENQIKNLFILMLKKYEINFSKLEIFSTSRRFVVFLNDLSKVKRIDVTEIRGPNTSAPKVAIDGFMNNNQIIDIKKLKKKKINDKEYYFFLKKNKQLSIEKIFEYEAPIILSSVKWKKSMRWSFNDEKWIRPIRNILCVYGNKKVNFCYAGVTSNLYTYGNYNYSSRKIKCSNVDSYKKNIKKEPVILDREERKKKILKSLESFCKKNQLRTEFDSDLLTRICNSVEWPNVFFAEYEKDFFKIPDFFLETIITEKQDNFCFYKKDGTLSSFFAFVSNKDHSKKKNLINGNQNVLKARFNDAKFFIDEDKKINLSERLKKLSLIIFYDNLGNLYDRSKRIVELSETISKFLGFNIEKFKEYLIYSNFDLTTEIVKEYPTLQGKVGAFYSESFDFNFEICRAFSEQYKVSLKKKNVDLSVILSISQKLDNIFAFFSSKKKVTGSGDPFGIRRMVISIIRILVDNNFSLDLVLLLKKCQQIYNNQGINFINDISPIKDFFDKRFENYLIENGFQIEVIKPCLSNDSFNPHEIYNKVMAINNFLNTNLGKDFMQAFKRLDSIVDDKHPVKNINQQLLASDEEKNLFKVLIEMREFTEENKFDLSNKIFVKITENINKFLDNIMVNVERDDVKNNRKALLLNSKEILDSFFKFSQIVENAK